MPATCDVPQSIMPPDAKQNLVAGEFATIFVLPAGSWSMSREPGFAFPSASGGTQIVRTRIDTRILARG